MKTLLLLLAFSLPALAGDFPDWMTGSWRMGNVEEHWTTADGGLMLGMSKTVGAKKTNFEFMRIARINGKLAFLAMPQGQPPTIFTLKTSEPSRIVFENPQHDFPQRIVYWRAAEKLCARIEGTLKGKSEAEEWCYAPL